MLDLNSFITELLEQQSVNDGILELSNQVKSEPCLREILLLARETDQFNRGLKSTNEKEAGFNLRECLELSILESKKDYLHKPGRRFFKELIERKTLELRIRGNNERRSEDLDATSKPLKKTTDEPKSIQGKDRTKTYQHINIPIISPQNLIFLTMTISILARLMNGEDSTANKPQGAKGTRPEASISKIITNKSKQFKIYLTEETITNIEEFYSFLNEDLSDALTCPELNQLLPHSFDNYPDFSSKSCEMTPPTSQHISHSETLREVINNFKLNTSNRNSNNKTRAVSLGYMWSTGSYSHALDRSFLYDTTSTTLHYTVYDRKSYLDIANPLYDKLLLYRSRYTSREWLRNFAHTNNYGHLRTNFTKISFNSSRDLPINNTQCSAKLDTRNRKRPESIILKCYKLSDRFSESFLGATRRFEPQLTTSIQFQRSGNAPTKSAECLPLGAEYLINNINSIREVPPGVSTGFGGNSKIYSKKCGNSKIKLIFKARNQSYLKRYQQGNGRVMGPEFPRAYGNYFQLVGFLDKEGREFELRPIFDVTTYPCKTTTDLHKNKIVIQNTCETKYTIHDQDTGSELNTSMLVRFLDMVSIITTSETPKGRIEPNI